MHMIYIDCFYEKGQQSTKQSQQLPFYLHDKTHTFTQSKVWYSTAAAGTLVCGALLCSTVIWLWQVQSQFGHWCCTESQNGNLLDQKFSWLNLFNPTLQIALICSAISSCLLTFSSALLEEGTGRKVSLLQCFIAAQAIKCQADLLLLMQWKKKCWSYRLVVALKLYIKSLCMYHTFII